ncbi:helix-turn-helix domain-containing protein [Paenibacillus rigui]|nr:helix-turn-helix domain-containing protein [Paenibacillus rigui]
MAENLNDPAASHMEETASPPSGILIAGHFTQPFGYQTYRSHGTRDWLITFTLSGSGQYRLNDELVTCAAGDIVLLPPGTPHDYRTPENSVWEFLWAHFVPLPHWFGWLELSREPGAWTSLHLEPGELKERVEAAFKRLLRDSLELDFYRGQLAMNAMEEILLLLSRNRTRQKSGTLDPRVDDIWNYLSSHMKEQHSVEQLAARVALSPSRLSHLFKEQVGESIMEALMRLRLRHASRLLEHTSLLVAEIAEEIGFHSPFYFTKQFTAHYGTSPSSYRKELRLRSEGN